MDELIVMDEPMDGEEMNAIRWALQAAKALVEGNGEEMLSDRVFKSREDMEGLRRGLGSALKKVEKMITDSAGGGETVH